MSIVDQYKQKVQGRVQQDLFGNAQYQQLQQFKQNAYNQSITQAVSFNTYRSQLNRQLSDQYNKIQLQQARGLTSGSVLRAETNLNQRAGTAYSQTVNQYVNFENNLNNQLMNVSKQEQQITDAFTQQEAQKAYEEDLQKQQQSLGLFGKIGSGIAGGTLLAGTILSLIPGLQPLGLALDIAGGTALAGVDIAQDVQNPSAGNIIQTIADIGLSAIPIAGGIRGAVVAGREARVARTLETTAEESTILPTEITQSLQEALPYTRPGSPNNPIISQGNVTRPLIPSYEGIVNSTSIESTIENAQKAGITEKQIEKVAADVGLKDLNQDQDKFLKFKTKLMKYFTDKAFVNRGAYARTTATQERLAKATTGFGTTRSIVGTVLRGTVKGAVGYAGRSFSQNALNTYFGNGNSNIDPTTLKWRSIFGNLGIPSNLWPTELQ